MWTLPLFYGYNWSIHLLFSSFIACLTLSTVLSTQTTCFYRSPLHSWEHSIWGREFQRLYWMISLLMLRLLLFSESLCFCLVLWDFFRELFWLLPCWLFPFLTLPWRQGIRFLFFPIYRSLSIGWKLITISTIPLSLSFIRTKQLLYWVATIHSFRWICGLIGRILRITLIPLPLFLRMRNNPIVQMYDINISF